MTTTIDYSAVSAPAEIHSSYSLTELVRGNDLQLIDEFSPLVRRQSVSLDLAPVERIDAAGIAALIALYRAAQECGHSFTLSNASPRVRELLALVGLDRILLAQPERAVTPAPAAFERHAA